jgi:hypothetical protein
VLPWVLRKVTFGTPESLSQLSEVTSSRTSRICHLAGDLSRGKISLNRYIKVLGSKGPAPPPLSRPYTLSCRVSMRGAVTEGVANKHMRFQSLEYVDCVSATYDDWRRGIMIDFLTDKNLKDGRRRREAICCPDDTTA